MKVQCYVCDIELKRDEIALCKKLLGRNIEKFMCTNCLAEYIDTTKEILEEKILEFKEQGCVLFK